MTTFQLLYALNLGSAPAPTPVFIRRAVVAALKADAALAGVVGTRVFPLVAPEGAVSPYLTYQLISDQTGQQLSGGSGVSRARFQFAACSRVQTDCEALTARLRDLFDGFQGDLPGPVAVIEAWTSGETDARVVNAAGTDRGLFRSTIDATFRYRRPRPTNQT